ncbi:hypothetical protein CTI12_AA463660 [Artemisia annua]|uniref:Uncharacterized protein n=1 Tax=Artemisia annua TaxID=35608 RepID=A0A2U1LQ88_ARTAN|nr:hypothetical protein CTI12_AA463660 [Artemisia annua]
MPCLGGKRGNTIITTGLRQQQHHPFHTKLENLPVFALLDDGIVEVQGEPSCYTGPLLVFSLLLPCLIFSQLGQAITLEKLIEWWFIPFNVVLATVSGSIIGFIVALIAMPPYPYFKFTIIQIAIGILEDTCEHTRKETIRDFGERQSNKF